MKSVSLASGIVAATIGGFGLLPGLTIFIGATVIATIITMLFCKRMDSEYSVVEKILYAMMANACLSAVISIAIPNAFSIEVEGFVLLFMLGGSLIGTFIGGGISSQSEHKQTRAR